MEDAFLGAPSIGELEIGVGILDPSKKQRMLERWLKKLITEFGARILPFDTAAAQIWGRAISAGRRRGVSRPVTDSQIAAIAGAHGLAVVTRNIRHFKVSGFDDLEVINPWSAS